MERLLRLDIAKVFPNPGQPRKEFDEFKLNELSLSIKEYGVMEPIVVTPRDGKFMIIATSEGLTMAAGKHKGE